eukprot:13071349-Alexandrium_andersonii.AAC.1
MAEKTLETPLTKCTVCGGALYRRPSHEATIYGFGVPQAVQVKTAMCVRKQCRSQHTYNLAWMDGKASNWFSTGDFVDG